MKKRQSQTDTIASYAMKKFGIEYQGFLLCFCMHKNEFNCIFRSKQLHKYAIRSLIWGYGHIYESERNPGLEVIKLFSCSTQLSRILIMLINVKMLTIVGILTFISMINTTSERFKASSFYICRYFNFYEQLKFHAQLS